MHVTRLGIYAKRVNPINLALSKARSEFLLCVVAITVSTLCFSNNECLDYFKNLISIDKDINYPVLIRTIIWNGAIAVSFIIIITFF
jgi:hypothetical protein